MGTRLSALAAIAHLGAGRLALLATLFVALSGAVPYVIYNELDGQWPVLDRRLLSWPVVVASLSLLVLYYCTDGLRLFYTLKALGYLIPIRHLSRLVFINILFSNITPMATGGGFAQIWYLRREGVHLGAATAATTLRTLLASVLIFIPTPFLMLSMEPLQASVLTCHSWGFYLALLALLYLTFFVLVLLRMRWIMAAAVGTVSLMYRYGLIGHARLHHWRFGLRREMVRFSHAIRAYLRGPRRDILLSVFFTVLFLLALFSFPALLLWGLGYRIDYLTVISLLVITTFIMYFAPTPGAAGIAEGVFSLLFARFVEGGDLLLIVVAWRFLTIHLGMLIGIPVTLHAVAQRAIPHA
jgi:uncharacterized protein (TIRG00374 family)